MLHTFEHFTYNDLVATIHSRWTTEEHKIQAQAEYNRRKAANYKDTNQRWLAEHMPGPHYIV